jgi:hypothetical protein
MLAENRRFARRKSGQGTAGRNEGQVYAGGVRLGKSRNALWAVPSLCLVLALALSTSQADQSKADSGHHQQTMVQHSSIGDTLIPPSDGKPCVGKPAGLSSLKFLDPGAVRSPRKRDSSSMAFPFQRNAIALSVSGHGGGRAPPLRPLI